MENFGIRFNNLFTMTNLPIKRFADFLYRRNELEVKYFFIKGSLRDFFKDFTSSIPFDVHIRHCNLKMLLSDMSNCFQMHARERCMANGSFKDGLIEAKMKLVIIFHSHICPFFHHSFFIILRLTCNYWLKISTLKPWTDWCVETLLASIIRADFSIAILIRYRIILKWHHTLKSCDGVYRFWEQIFKKAYIM